MSDYIIRAFVYVHGDAIIRLLNADPQKKPMLSSEQHQEEREHIYRTQ